MTIELGTGNLLTADVDALVNTVNTQGVMGKGLALQFKKAFPEAFTSYELACRNGEISTGRMHVVRRLASPRYIINFPTKKHWRNPSKLEYIQTGLTDLVQQVRTLGIQSMAMPPLGCGHGGLAWRDVRPLIEAAFAGLTDVRVVLYAPAGAPVATEIIDRRPVPPMTPGRAAVLALMGAYLKTGYEYRLSLVEVQKLAYFLQVAGERLRLTFHPHHYGPYADTLRKALRNMEGHQIRGVGDGDNKPGTKIDVLPGAFDAASKFLADQPASVERLEKVAKLIEGFESPFGMELLGTVHWVMTHDADANDVDDVVKHVHGWSARKQSAMKDGHIRAAWSRLNELGWAALST